MRVVALLCFLVPNPLLTCAADSSPAQDRRPVVFGPAKHLAELPVLKSCFSDQPKPAGVQTQTITFEQDESECFIYPAPEGYVYLAVGELQPGTEPDQPQLPMKTFIVTLEKEAEVYGIEVVDGAYREIQQPLSIVPIPMVGFHSGTKYLPDDRTYRATTLFPGYLLSSSACSAANLKDPGSLAGKLRQPLDRVSRYLNRKLPETTRQALTTQQGSEADLLRLQKTLARDLNQVVWGESIYDPQRFGEVTLRSETQQLLAQQARGEGLLRLNRLLLEDTYPREISRDHLANLDRGLDNERQQIFVRFCPLQYIPAQKKAFLITSATLKVYYRDAPKPGPTGPNSKPVHPKLTSEGVPMLRAECVILCPEALKNEAKRLSEFHTSAESIPSAVVTTEAIASGCAPAEEPVSPGYANDRLEGRGAITKYNYTLARKIITYLRDQTAHPCLTYVTILGDGLLVPPSYYSYYGKVGSLDARERWVPSDFFYMSPDYDFVPNFRVGRLPVNDRTEATAMVDKGPLRR